MKNRKKYKIIRDVEKREEIVKFALQGERGSRQRAVERYGISRATLMRWCRRWKKKIDLGVKERRRGVKKYDEKEIYKDALFLWIERGQPKRFSAQFKEEIRQMMISKLTTEELKGRKVHDTCIWRLLRYMLDYLEDYTYDVEQKFGRMYIYNREERRYKKRQHYSDRIDG